MKRRTTVSKIVNQPDLLDRSVNSIYPLVYQNIPVFTSLTLSQTTNFRLFQTERVCRRQFQI